MGRASSAKKAARLAKSSGQPERRGRQMMFPVAMVAIVVLGLGLVAWARNDSTPSSASPTDLPAVGDKWFASYGVFLCDHWAPPLTGETSATPSGIFTQGDGLIHIEPTDASSAGKRATLGKFFDSSGLHVSSSSIELPDGRVFKVGTTTCSGKPAQVTVTRWSQALEASQGAKAESTFTKDFGSVHFDQDLSAYTIAFAPKGTAIPPPQDAGQINEKAQAAGGGSGNSSVVTTPDTSQVSPSVTGTPDTGATSDTSGSAGVSGTPDTGAVPDTAPATSAP